MIRGLLVQIQRARVESTGDTLSVSPKISIACSMRDHLKVGCKADGVSMISRD